MKHLIFAAIILITIHSFTSAQVEPNKCAPMLGQNAPSFTAVSTMGKVNFPNDYWTKWKIIFSHPADFTAVCSTEILELANMQDDFEKLNTAVMVISTDGLNSHIEWVRSLEDIMIDGKPAQKIRFPLISDADLSISRKYGMIYEDANSQKRDIRAVYIINPENKVSAIFSYPSNVGRNMQEIKRTLIALQTSEKYDVLTPVNWNPGADVLIHSPVSVEDSRKLEEKNESDLYMKQWYMWYKKLPQASK
jgi:peroxiredoxin (alkyl hydroperoxide reductase subunit C)